MSNDPMSRRKFIMSVPAGTLMTSVLASAAQPAAVDPQSSLAAPAPGALQFRVRALTAGVSIESASDARPIERALAFLERSKRRFAAAGYEVQTLRVATNPFLRDAASDERDGATDALLLLDRKVAEAGAVLSIGPIQSRDASDEALGAWASDLAKNTRATSCSICVSSPERGVDFAAVRAAGAVVLALSRALPAGVANFRFAAAAHVPPGTPFFPVAYHEGEAAFAVGLETPKLVKQAFENAATPVDASEQLRALLDAQFASVEKLAAACAQEGRRRYLGIDSSPAPAADSSIGAAIEALTHAPLGAPSTLQACAAITGAIKSLRVKTCGYCGLMLPILEDPVLAARAAEGRISVRDLLLYSSVCGTGLDVVPLAGDVTAEAVSAVIGDVATLATRLRKPLSARLFPIPGKAPGDAISFQDPMLFPSKVLPL